MKPKLMPYGIDYIDSSIVESFLKKTLRNALIKFGNELLKKSNPEMKLNDRIELIREIDPLISNKTIRNVIYDKNLPL